MRNNEENEEKRYGAYHTVYRYSSRRTGKNACLFSRKRDDIPEWRNDYGIFQFHEKNRVDSLWSGGS